MRKTIELIKNTHPLSIVVIIGMLFVPIGIAIDKGMSAGDMVFYFGWFLIMSPAVLVLGAALMDDKKGR